MVAKTILRLPEVQQRTGLGRSTIYQKLASKEEKFPEPVSLGPRAIGWIEDEIDDWIEQRICQSRDRMKSDGSSNRAPDRKPQKARIVS